MTSLIDNFIIQIDRALYSIAAKEVASRQPSPAEAVEETELTQEEASLSASLMRVNHTGEVCAQALYLGQSISSDSPKVRARMQQAAEEEADHLSWCQQRLQELQDKPSILNPLFYRLSFFIGLGVGSINDKISLGFTGAIEEQVCEHLERHQKRLPLKDLKSRAIIEQMLIDERNHSDNAYISGGIRFPKPVQRLMTLGSKVMTLTAARI